MLSSARMLPPSSSVSAPSTGGRPRDRYVTHAHLPSSLPHLHHRPTFGLLPAPPPAYCPHSYPHPYIHPSIQHPHAQFNNSGVYEVSQSVWPSRPHHLAAPTTSLAVPTTTCTTPNQTHGHIVLAVEERKALLSFDPVHIFSVPNPTEDDPEGLQIVAVAVANQVTPDCKLAPRCPTLQIP